MAKNKGVTSTDWALTPEAYVKLLYREILGREPDEKGFQDHVSALRASGDHTRVLSYFVNSPERKAIVLNGALQARGSGGSHTANPVTMESVDLDLILSVSQKHFNDIEFFQKLASAPPFKNHNRDIKNIAIYYWRLNNGGTERVTALLIKLWRRIGYNVILLTDELADPISDYDCGPGITRYVIPARSMDKYDYSARGQMLAGILINEQIDVFVTNQWFELSTYWDILVAKSIGIPVIVGWHNAFDAGMDSAGTIGRAYLRYLGCRHADLVAVLSKVDEAWFHSCGVAARLVHNPLTFDKVPDTPAPLDGKTVVWIARAERHQKRIDLALRMFLLVLDRVRDARLVIVGGGGDLDWAREYSAALGIASRVFFVGYTTEVHRYIDRAAVHVMTSEFEGYPMVLGEVWSHGVPTVLFDLPQLEYLRRGKGHIAVEQGNVVAMADAVTNLLEDDDLRRKLGAEAREVVCDIAAEDLSTVWADIFQNLNRADAIKAVEQQPDDPADLRILVQLLAERLMKLRDDHAPATPDIWMPSAAALEPPRHRWNRDLVLGAKAALFGLQNLRKALGDRLFADRRLRMIDLSGVGLGDNIMIWTGLFALLSNGTDVCAQDCTLHVPGILVDLANELFARFGLKVVGGRPEQEVSPLYTPLPPSNYKQWWATYLGVDWRMNWVEALDLQKTFPRHGADRAFRSRVRLHLSERILYRRHHWAQATPGYIGYRVWAPLALSHGVVPLRFLAQLKRSLAEIRTIVADYVDAMTPAGDRASYSGNAAFPAGKSFQTISPKAYTQIDTELGGNFFTCYVQNDSAWKDSFDESGVKIRNIPNMSETFRIIKYAKNLLTTDSFTSHIAQLLRDDFVIVLSRDFKENIIHPGCNPEIFVNHPPCAPCNYQERADFKHCVAGYKFCTAFENREFCHKIADAFKVD
jgi:glycosyltransferase involved in cell wall biosynthesis